MIIYKTIKEYSQNDLKELFASVGWVSADYSDRLVKAIANSDTVISAWDKEKLVGLINVLDDGDLTAYVHYLLIRPDYQNSGIGKELIRQLKSIYKDYLYICLTAENKEVVPFYEKQGFRVVEGGLPMIIYNP
ncbi:MAG: GNAT family N-acetyltransferase [Lachnospiraceae bacterium]|nr:GNAT family N-acetyltransferase [Lachnospiraceae bacterium]MBR1817206.1 GNAT family N-acetyltransferase [Lachnospiraceae bacterium]